MVRQIQDKSFLRNKSCMAAVNFFAGSKPLHVEALNSLRGEDIEGLGCLAEELSQFKISSLLARKLNMFHREQ